MASSISSTISHKRVNSILAIQRQNDIIGMLLDAKDSKEIVQYLVSKYRLTVNTANFYLKEARSLIRSRRKYEVNNLVSLHLERYEELFKMLTEIGADNIAMKALAGKEKLMGFHREGFHMKVTQGEITSVQLQTVDSDYNVNKLTKEKREHLLILLNKAKRDGRDRSYPVNGGSDQGVRESGKLLHSHKL